MRSILITLALVAMGQVGYATVVVPADLGELSRDARAIARGHVVAVLAQWTADRRTIETIVTLETEKYLKGQLGDTVAFRVPGGSFGRFRNIVVGAPIFAVGQRVIVFLGARGPTVPLVLGFSQGVFHLGQDAAGAWMVSPPPVLPDVLGVRVRGGPALVSTPLDDFEKRVRTLSEEASR